MRKFFRLSLVAPLLVLSACFGLVFTPTVVHADTIAPPQPLYDNTVKVPVETTKGTTTIGSICKGKCATVLRTLKVGMSLFNGVTTFMPMLSGLLGMGQNDTSHNDPGLVCSVKFSAGMSGPHILTNFTWSGCTTTSPLGKAQISAKCRDITTGLVTLATGLIGGRPSSTSGSGTSTPSVQVCALGQEVVYAELWNEWTTITIGRDIPDAQYQQTTKVTCRKPDGTTGIIQSVNKDKGKVVFPSCAEEFGPGSFPLDATGTAGWAGSENPLFNTSFDENMANKYPECFSASGAYLDTCRVHVWIDGNVCTVGATGCGTWDELMQDEPQRVKCKWGPYVVSMSNCNPELKKKYQVGTKPRPETDNDPETGAPKPPKDPDTGTPTTTGPGCWDNCTPPKPDLPEDPQDAESCLAAAISWNPVDWVFTPIKCAFMWAFIPPEGTFDAALSRISDPLSDAYTPWMDAISGGFSGIEAGGGNCNGPGFPLPDTLQRGGLPSPFYPVRACSGTAATLAGYSHTISTVLLVIATTIKTVEMVQTGLGLSTHHSLSRGFDWSGTLYGRH